MQKFKKTAYFIVFVLSLLSSQNVLGNVINYEPFGSTSTWPSGAGHYWSATGSSWTLTNPTTTTYTLPASGNTNSAGYSPNITMNGSNSDNIKTSNIDCSSFISGALFFAYRFSAAGFTKSIIVEVSRNGGTSWTTVSTITNPSNTNFNVKTIILPTGTSGGSIDGSSTVQIRFSSSGTGSGTTFFNVDDIELDGFKSITPFDLSNNFYLFNTWASTSASGTYPANMAFHQSATQDPTISTLYYNSYTGAYNTGSGSRVDGKGSSGFTFTNTGTSGFMGQAVLALNTTGRTNVIVSWTSAVPSTGTGYRTYKLRMQYQVGGLAGTWNDADTTGTYLDVTQSSSGSAQNLVMGPIKLPYACQNQSAVYLRWVYYYSTGSGTRPEMGVSNITVSSAYIKTEDILPQFIQGTTVSSNTQRLPYACRLTIGGLGASKTYRYNTQMVLSSDNATVSGVGNPIYVPSSGSFTLATSVDLSTSGRYGSFTTDASGNYTGWFAIEPTGNSKFTKGNSLLLKLLLNDGNSGTTQIYQAITNSTIKVLELNGTSTSSDGSGIYGVSNASAKDFVMLYDNTAGTGRPLSGTYIESDGVTQTTNYAGYYGTNVDGSVGAWGTVIPNSNANGVRRIESRLLNDGSIDCYSTSSAGTWPSGATTASPTSGTTAKVITKTDAPLSSCHQAIVTLSSSSSSVVSTASGTEAAATVVTITATAASAVSTSETVNLSVSGTGITSGDYTLSNTAITIAAGQTQGSVTFTVTDDAIAEVTEVANVSISSVSTGLTTTGSSNTAVAISITDNDVPHVDLSFSSSSSVSSTSSSEATPTNKVTIYATSSAAVNGDQTITLGVSGTGITSGDYSLSSSGVITILSGQTQGFVTFTITDDALAEGSEKAFIGISSTSSLINTTGSSVTSISVDIADNDIPIVTLSSSSSSVVSTASGTEAATTVVTLTATASTAVGSSETVNLSVSGSGITSGDYTLSSTAITIASGQTQGSVTFTIKDDAIAEVTEVANVSISSVSTGLTTTGSSNTAVDITITDNDVPHVDLSFSSSSSVSSTSSSEATPTNKVTIYATSSAAVTGDQTITLGVSGTGITSGDYSFSSSGVITILSGQTQGFVTFTITDDALAEGSEKAIIGISSTSSLINTTGSSVTSISVDIADNDVPYVDLSFSSSSSVSSASSSEATPANTVTIYATSSAAVTGNQTITLNVSGTNITSGDYSLSNSGVITILNGQTQGSVTLTVTDDAAIEGSETATIGISFLSSLLNTTGSTVTSLSLGITDNDFPIVTLSSSSSSVVSTASGTEAAATVVTLTATASAAVPTSQTVNLGVSGTGITSGDYTLSNTAITIAAGQTQGSVTFTITDDAIAEVSEVASVSISSVSAGLTTTGSSNTAVAITITDNDVPHVDLSFSSGASVSTASSSEATPANTVRIYATSSAAVNGDQTITLSVSGTNVTSGDYSLSNSGVITILSGQTQGYLDLTVTDDALVEVTETANIGISSTSSLINTTGSSVTSLALSITDNDLGAIVNLYVGSSGTSTSASSYESTPAQTVTIRAVLSSTLSTDQTVTLGSVTGTSITSGDYSLSGSTITILAGNTSGSVTFTVTDDATSESTETASIGISSVSSSLTTTGNNNSTVTISIADNEDRIIMGSSGSYFQDFNTLASTGSTSSSMPAGWYFSESGSNANSTYAVGTGSSTTGDTYSFGITSASDRALGTLSSGSITQDIIGAQIMNMSGSTMNHIYMSFKIEQWRAGGSRTLADYLNFQYSTNATSVSDASATWIDANGLDVTSVLSPSTSAGNFNGNSSGNFKRIGGTITNLNLANNSTMWIRWVDVNVFGSDDGLAIDDIYISQPKNVWYDKVSGDLGNSSNWTDNASGGSGNSPSNFSDTAQVYVIINQSSPVIGAGAAAPNANSVLVIGDGSVSPTLTINSGSSWAGNISVSNGATVDIKSSTLPTLHEIKSGSTVYYDNAGATITLPTLPFSNLKFNGVTVDAPTNTQDGNFPINVPISGNLSVVNTTFTSTWRDNVNLLTSGNGAQTISGGSSATTVSMYSLNSTKSAGGLTLASNANLDIEGSLSTVYTGSSVFADGGNIITVGDDLEMDGTSSSNYNLTGTVVMTTEGANKVTFTNGNIRNKSTSSTYIVAKLNNLTIDQTGQTGSSLVQFTTDLNKTGSIYINGTLYIKNTTTGNVQFSTNSGVPTIYVNDFKMDAGTLDFGTGTPFSGSFTSILNVAGNFTKTGGTITCTKTTSSGKIIFGKAGTQTFSNNSTNSLDNVSIDVNAGSTLQLNSNLPLYSKSTINRIMTVNGTLDAGTYSILESTSGSNNNTSQFTLNGTLKSSATNGIGDNIAVGGTKTLADSANYELYGSSTMSKAGFNTLGKTKARNITISNSSAGGVTMDGTDFDITMSGALNVGASTYLIIPNLNNFKKATSTPASVTINGTVEVQDVHGLNDASTAAFQGYDTTSDFTFGSSSLVSYKGSGSQTITPANYAHLKITGARASSSTITFAGAGIIGIAGDFTCDATGTGLSYAWNGSIFNINGSSSQSLPAFALNVNNLALSKGDVKTINADLTVNGTLNLSKGFIKLDDHDLVLGNSAVTSGGNANSYVRISGTGKLKRQATSSGVFYPIGYNPYLPVTITLEGGASATNFSVGVTNGVTDQTNAPVNSNVIGKTWTIIPEAGAGTLNNVTVTLQWDNVDVNTQLTGFNTTTSYMAYRTSLTGDWTRINNSYATLSPGTVANSSQISSDPISLVGGTTYYFGIGSGASPLPVKLIKFNANAKGADVILDWSTASEINNAGFEVERSQEGNFWQAMGYVKGHGNSNSIIDYTFTDASAFKTQNTDILYYRLKQVDFNGSSSYSNVKTVRSNDKADVANIYPNPVDGIATMSIYNNLDNEMLELNILDEAGRILIRQKAMLTKGNNSILLETDKLKKGIYLLEMKTNEKIQYVKFLKN